MWSFLKQQENASWNFHGPAMLQNILESSKYHRCKTLTWIYWIDAMKGSWYMYISFKSWQQLPVMVLAIKMIGTAWLWPRPCWATHLYWFVCMWLLISPFLAELRLSDVNFLFQYISSKVMKYEMQFIPIMGDGIAVLLMISILNPSRTLHHVLCIWTAVIVASYLWAYCSTEVWLIYRVIFSMSSCIYFIFNRVSGVFITIFQRLRC